MQPVTHGLPLVMPTGVHSTAKLLRDPEVSVATGRPFRLMRDVVDQFESLIPSGAIAGDHDVPDSGVPIKQQAGLGSCVLNSTSRALETALWIQYGKPVPALARLFAYWLCSKAMGSLGQDTGTYVHLAVERYGSIGICEETIWPYTDDAATFFKPPPGVLEAIVESSDNRPTSWVKINESDPQTKLAQMELAIRADHTICFGAPVDSTIQRYVAGQVLTVPNPQDIIGGHSMQITGIRTSSGPRKWRLANSWGTDYGDNGYLLIDDAWAQDPDFADLWIMSRVDALAI